MIHFATVRSDGIIEYFDRKAVELDIEKFRNKEIQIEIKKVRKSLTEKQRNYFHLLLTVFCKDNGEDSFDDLKETIKKHFGPREEFTDFISGKKDLKLKSSEEYSDDEYSIMIKKTVDFFKDFYPGFVIPDPELYKLNKFYK